MSLRDWLHDFTTRSFARAIADAGFVERGLLHAAERVIHGAIDEGFDRLESPARPPPEPTHNLP